MLVISRIEFYFLSINYDFPLEVLIVYFQIKDLKNFTFHISEFFYPVFTLEEKSIKNYKHKIFKSFNIELHCMKSIIFLIKLFNLFIY
jgi:hypothetical protein